MSMLNKHAIKVLLGVFLMLGFSSQVFAVGTPSGTPVDNQATITFSVGGSAQPPVVSDDPGQAGVQATRFIVDTKVDVTVVWQDGAAVPVAPGQDGVTPIPNPPQVLRFTVTNLGNTPTQDFALTSENLAGDDFDPTAVSIYVDSNGNNTYDVGVDTATNIDELSSTAGTNSVDVFLVGSIGAQTNGQLSDTALIATAHDGGGAGLGALTTEDAGVDVALGPAQVAFAEGAGTATGDIATDGAHSATGTYIVSVTLTVNKTSSVIADGVGGVAPNAKAIPGATVQYTIAITNNGAAAATAIGGSDPLDTANITFVSPSVAFDAGCGGATASNDAPAIATLTFSVGTIAAGATCNITFNVTIN